jgi:hypothetical protein
MSLSSTLVIEIVTFVPAFATRTWPSASFCCRDRWASRMNSSAEVDSVRRIPRRSWSRQDADLQQRKM